VYLLGLLINFCVLFQDFRHPFASVFTPSGRSSAVAKNSNIIFNLSSFGVDVLEIAALRLNIETERVRLRLKLIERVGQVTVLLAGGITTITAWLKIESQVWSAIEQHNYWLLSGVALLFGGGIAAWMLALALAQSNYYVGIINLVVKIKKSSL
jgi:hypothetical protein